jgi:hypothetical protein
MVKIIYLYMSNTKCCICGTIKNCEKYLKYVFKNIKKITELFVDYYIIVYYDDSSDNTLKKLIKYKKYFKIHIYHNIKYKNDCRTHRLAYGRNYCLKIINKYFSNFKYFIMMDFDDVCTGEINISVLKKYIDNDSNWDSLSFNKSNYYDLWALSIRPYIFSYIHFNNPYDVLHNMGIYINDKLKSLNDNELLPCFSAFNGFAIYKTQVFKDCIYDGNIRLDLIPLEYLKENIQHNKSEIVMNEHNWLNSKKEDCEHRSFHFAAIKKNNARIFISPEILMV